MFLTPFLSLARANPGAGDGVLVGGKGMRGRELLREMVPDTFFFPPSLVLLVKLSVQKISERSRGKLLHFPIVPNLLLALE